MEIYLIVMGIGITEALMKIPMAGCNWTFFGYLMILFGYLSTVARFALEGILMLEHLTTQFDDKAQHKIDTSQFIALICLLLCTLCFFLMGHNVLMLGEFMIYCIWLFVFDSLMIILRHRPWVKPKAILYCPAKFLGIVSNFILFPRHAPQKAHPDDPDKCLIKLTHYQWLRTNFWQVLIIVSFLFLWKQIPIESVCPFHVPTSISGLIQWLQQPGHELWAYQAVVGMVLLYFSINDFLANQRYYFGRDEDDPIVVL